jgi:hypothetical protein
LPPGFHFGVVVVSVEAYGVLVWGLKLGRMEYIPRPIAATTGMYLPFGVVSWVGNRGWKGSYQRPGRGFRLGPAGWLRWVLFVPGKAYWDIVGEKW